MSLRLTLLAVVLCGGPAVGSDAFEVTTPGSPGTGGVVPVLEGAGPAKPGSLGNSFTISMGPASGSAFLVLGLSELAAPFKGGILGPAPDVFLPALGLDASGGLGFVFALPADVPAGLEVFAQAWLPDPGVVPAFSATNTLKLTLLPNGLDSLSYFALNNPVGFRLADLEQADLDLDGKLDVVVLNDITDTVVVHLGRGDGFFVEAGSHAVVNDPAKMTLVDLTGDGLLDIVVMSEQSKMFSVLVGTGGADFAAKAPITVDDPPIEFELVDFNNNGVPDLLVVMEGSFDVSFVASYIGVGDGSFEAPVTTNTHVQHVDAPIIGDWNADGVPDIAMDGSPSAWWSSLGNPDGSFGPFLQHSLSAGLGGRPREAVDVNLDGRMDLVWLAVPHTLQPGRVSTFLSHPSGNFGLHQELDLPTVSNFGYHFEARDMNGDGRADLVFAADGGDEAGDVYVAEGGGLAGAFAPFDLLGSLPPFELASMGDVDSDGDVDFTTHNGFVVNDPGSFALQRWAEGEGFTPFAPPPIGAEPSGLALHDLDHDGQLDLSVALIGSDEVAIASGRGDGTFREPVVRSVGSEPAAILLADLDGDGEQDLVTANRASNDVSVLLGLGDASFGPESRYAVLADPRAIDAVDVNGDGVPDLVVACRGADAVAVLLGDGAGGFAAAQALGVGAAPVDIASADLNGDGSMDLVTANESATTVSILLASGAGSFAAAESLVSGHIAGVLVELGDLDGDGTPDLVLFPQGFILFPAELMIYSGVGDGSFSLSSTVNFDDDAVALELTDLDGDDVLDVVAATARLPPGADDEVDQLVIALGSGDGSFGPVQSFPLGPASNAVAVGDIDGDCLPDLISSDAITEEVWTLLQRLDP